MMSEVEIAETIARIAHYGQVVKSTGEDFIMHPQAVAEMLPMHLKPAGWLHDVIEDEPFFSPGRLLAAGIHPRTIDIVVAVSRQAQESYDDFIRRVISTRDRNIIRVKHADMTHNRRAGCPPKLMERYDMYYPLLCEALR